MNPSSIFKTIHVNLLVDRYCLIHDQSTVTDYSGLINKIIIVYRKLFVIFLKKFQTLQGSTPETDARTINEAQPQPMVLHSILL